MLRAVRRFLTAAPVSLALAVLIIAPAQADIIWQTGAKVSHTFHSSWPSAESIGGSSKCAGTYDAVAEVKLDGDYVYVADTCTDGRSAMAQVITYNEAGNSVRHRYCRNPHGYGTWAQCNWDWPEGSNNTCDLTTDPPECYNLVLVAGSYDGNTGNLYWDHGNSSRFRD